MHTCTHTHARRWSCDAPPPQVAVAPQRPTGGAAAAVPLRAGGGDERPSVGEVVQRSADSRNRQPATELREHDAAAETAAVQARGTGGTVDPPEQQLPVWTPHLWFLLPVWTQFTSQQLLKSFYA